MLLDTDVLIDVALDRAPHVRHSAALLSELERRPPSAFVAWHSLSNFYYLVRASRSDTDAREFLSELTRFVQVAPSDAESLRFAAGLKMKDFEDALQVGAARAVGAEVIVTRNGRDYRNAPIQIATPRQALQRLAG